MKALVVDDSDAVREILASHLARLGFDVDAAADGLQAVSLAAQSAPEVVLLDWAMPGMDGLEVLRRLRGYPDRAHPGHHAADAARDAVRRERARCRRQ
jgi:CheY-like chemotaxis protein